MTESDQETTEAAAGQEEGIRTSINRRGECECEVTIEADAEYLENRYRERLGAFAKEVSVPGFRQGKAPAGLVERKFGQSLRKEVLSTVLEEAYDRTREEKDLEVVGEKDLPDVEEMEWEVGQPATFRFTCEVLPQLELDEKDYKGLTVEVPVLEVNDETVNQEMERLRERFRTWESVEEPSIDREDVVEALVELEDPAVGDRAWSEHYDFRPCDERIGPFAPKGLEGALLGAKKGDAVVLEAECLPEEPIDALKELADQTTRIKVSIENVYRAKVPALDDKLAERAGFSSLDQLRVTVEEGLQRRAERDTENIKEYAVVEALVDKMDLPMPESLVEGAAEEQQRRWVIRQLRTGRAVEEVKEDSRRIAEQSREQAERALKAAFLLRQIADKERIFVTESEVDEQIRALAAGHGWSEQRTRRYLEEQEMLGSLRRDMREAKTRQFLVENASFTEIDPQVFADRRRQRSEEKEESE